MHRGYLSLLLLAAGLMHDACTAERCNKPAKENKEKENKSEAERCIREAVVFRDPRCADPGVQKEIAAKMEKDPAVRDEVMRQYKIEWYSVGKKDFYATADSYSAEYRSRGERGQSSMHQDRPL